MRAVSEKQLSSLEPPSQDNQHRSRSNTCPEFDQLGFELIDQWLLDVIGRVEPWQLLISIGKPHMKPHRSGAVGQWTKEILKSAQLAFSRMVVPRKERGFSSTLSVLGYPENIRTETYFPHYLYNSFHLLYISYHVIQTASANEYSCTWDRERRIDDGYEGYR